MYKQGDQQCNARNKEISKVRVWRKLKEDQRDDETAQQCSTGGEIRDERKVQAEDQNPEEKTLGRPRHKDKHSTS